jgi:hypothetical protein
MTSDAKRNTLLALGFLALVLLVSAAIGSSSLADANNGFACEPGWTTEKCTEATINACRQEIAANNEKLLEEKNAWKRDHEEERGTPQWGEDYRELQRDINERRADFIKDIRKDRCAILGEDAEDAGLPEDAEDANAASV